MTELRSRGIQPDVIVCRSDKPISEWLKRKISLQCDVAIDAVISAVDAPSIYEIPLVLHEQGLDAYVCRTLGIDEATHPIDLSEWEALVDRVESVSRRVKVGIVGKYVNMPDAYMSVVEALRHAGFHHGAQVELDWIDAELVPGLLGTDRLRGLDAIVIPGGFGERGIEGMVAAAGYSRDNGIPCLGLCLGLHVMVISVARDRAGLERANSREFDSLSPHLVIDLMPDQAEVTEKGGTMRLGSYQAVLQPDSKVAKAYGTLAVTERHRHRFEFNNRYKSRLEAVGLVCSGMSPDGRLVEFVELADHPYWVATQAHPEFKSRPDRPHLSSASWWRRRSSGRRGASRTCSTSTPSPSGAVPGFRRVSEEELLRAWLFRVDRFHVRRPRRRAVRPLRRPPPRRGVRRAGARRRHGHAGPPVPGRGGRHGARDPRRHPRQRGTRRRRHGPARAGRGGRPRGGDVGAADRHLEHAGGQRPAHDDLPGDRPHAVPSRPDGIEERFMSVERIRLADLDALVADGTLQGRDDGARALPGPRPPGRHGPAAVTAALPRPAEEFLSWLEVERGRSPRTLAAYRRDLAAYEASVAVPGGTTHRGRHGGRRGRASGRAAPHAQRGVGRPGPLEHPRLPPLPASRRVCAPTTRPWTCPRSRSPTSCPRR